MCLHSGRGQPLRPRVDTVAGSPTASILRHLIGCEINGRENTFLCFAVSLWLSLATQRAPSLGSSFSFNGTFVWFPSVVLVPSFPGEAV